MKRENTVVCICQNQFTVGYHHGSAVNLRNIFVQNRRQELLNRGSLHLCKGAWDSKIWQKLYFFIVSYLSLGGLEFCLGG